jgi:hypothetical protein
LRYGKDYNPNYKKKQLAIKYGKDYDPKYKHNKRKGLALREAQRSPLPSPDYRLTSPAYCSIPPAYTPEERAEINDPDYKLKRRKWLALREAQQPLSPLPSPDY